MASTPDPTLEALASYVLAPLVIIITVVYLICEVTAELREKPQPEPPPVVQQDRSLSYKAGAQAKKITFDFVKGFFSR